MNTIKQSIIQLFALVAVLSSSIALSQINTSVWTTEDDHQHMMQQLGIEGLRPGPSGQPDKPNAANTDEALANPYPQLPDILTLSNGDKVTTLQCG